MKGIVVLIIIILAACYFFLRMGSETGDSKPQPGNAPAQAQQTNGGDQGNGEKPKGAISTFTDYATGYTPLKVMQHSQKKVNTINDAHNQKLMEAMGEE